MPRLLLHRNAPSAGAVTLVAALREAGVNAYKMSRDPRRRRNDDAVVGWGDHYPWFEGKALNNVPVINKLQEVSTLRDAGVATVEFSLTPQDDWLPRVTNHHGGSDLLNPPARPHFWTKREEIRREFRVHVWRGVSMRAGVKLPRIDTPHPWVRSYDGGWYIDYGQAEAHGFRQRNRDLAKDAVRALGLDFGAVDLAERQDGSLLVLEVNRAPGLEGNTTVSYRDRIVQWLNEPVEETI
jgi:hypothetical protein